jgi:hypothetical protein
MAKGDVQLSPWVWTAGDYQGLVIRITVNFNDTTRALVNAVVHRDDGCMFTKIVFDIPSDGVKSKRLPAPLDGQGDRTYSKGQMSAQGLDTFEDVMAVQITAEP